MRVAIKHEFLNVDRTGHVIGHDAGDTLVRRLLRLFPGAHLIGARGQRFPDLDIVPLEMVDAGQTLIINMDVVDSVTVWRGCRTLTERPRVMNFLWWDVNRYDNPVEKAALALSCALFPTFTNSERTSRATADMVRRWTVKPLADRARISGVNLGIRLEHVQPRDEPDIPVVLYPAIYVSERKQPNQFIDIVTAVAQRTPIRVEARLSGAHLASEPAMRLARQPWASVGPIVPSRADYWQALAHTTAFLATAAEESYGLEYVEALVAGAVGIFPDRDWAHALVPADYPFFYRTPAEAEDLLERAVTDTAACRQALDGAADGDFIGWLRDRHDDDNFEAAIAEHVMRWFGPVTVASTQTGHSSPSAA
ncbi:MAG: glycosyltransferase family 1 protein [Propionibacteriaceae bacterium]|jgi:hypothetical protein|nr:glycosyltransferase family 1 protein [Propionibacteriaceae bacterium]